VTDNVNLSQIHWVAGKYDEREIENLFVFERAVAEKRVGYIIQALERYCLDRSEIIGIGFCLSKKHAEFMAQVFNKEGIPSEFLIAESEDAVRDSVKHRQVTKEITFVFVVDIYNEGIDIPEVNTVLFLRPTESLTIFLQQLGRGLRLSEGKGALTVLDFVGQAHHKYSFEDRFKALLSRTRKSVEHEIKHGFANVPRGCSIQLEKQAQDYILENIRNAVNTKRQAEFYMNVMAVKAQTGSPEQWIKESLLLTLEPTVTLNHSLMVVLIEMLKSAPLKEIAIGLCEQMRKLKTTPAMHRQDQKYYLRGRNNALTELIFMLNMVLGEKETAIADYKSNYKDIDNEIGLYVLLRHLSNYREKALWLREYELGLQQKVQPRKALVETYKCIKETGDFPQY